MTPAGPIRDADHRANLKRDLLGSVTVESTDGVWRVVRDTGDTHWSLRWLARHLARREARALGMLDALTQVPAVVSGDGDCLVREYLPGEPMHLGVPPAPEYFRHALRLLRQIHRHGIAHNDLAKEANWIRLTDGMPGIVDFQLAFFSGRRGRVFRLLAREDLRHMLKHKRRYCPQALSRRQTAILQTPAWPARWWRRLVKPPYLFVTRRLLGWPERDGAAEREY